MVIATISMQTSTDKVVTTEPIVVPELDDIWAGTRVSVVVSVTSSLIISQSELQMFMHAELLTKII